MILSSSESSVCLGKHSVMWVITSCDSSVFLGNTDFCIRRVTYTGLRRKKFVFQKGKSLGISASHGGFLVEILLLVGCRPVFIALKTDFQLTPQLTRAE